MKVFILEKFKFFKVYLIIGAFNTTSAVSVILLVNVEDCSWRNETYNPICATSLKLATFVPITTSNSFDGWLLYYCDTAVGQIISFNIDNSSCPAIRVVYWWFIILFKPKKFW